MVIFALIDTFQRLFKTPLRTDCFSPNIADMIHSYQEFQSSEHKGKMTVMGQGFLFLSTLTGFVYLFFHGNKENAAEVIACGLFMT